MSYKRLCKETLHMGPIETSVCDTDTRRHNRGNGVSHYFFQFNKFEADNLTLSCTANCNLFQTERACRQQFHIRLKWQEVLQLDGKHCGKRRNCSLRAISPFPSVFSKHLHCRHRACLGKG